MLKFAKTYNFVACTLLLADILPHLNRLSLLFQNQCVDLTLIQPCIEATKESIQQYRDNPGPHMTTIESVISASDLKEFNIPITELAKEQFKTQVQDKYIEAVVDGLFPTYLSLRHLGFFNPQKCPSSQDELVDYGLGKLRLLQEKYGTGDDPDVDSEACVSEWESFKRLIQSYSSLNMTQMVTAMVTDSNLKDMYPELTKLATIAAILPVSTACCERAFSAMKRIKTELRNNENHYVGSAYAN